MRILVTTSRMPAALDEIRKLGRLGHEVHASDTFRSAPGNHSRYAFGASVTPSPRSEPAAFVAAIARIVRERRIELVVPGFEDALLLAQHLPEVGTPVWTARFDTLHALHNKATFCELARGLGLEVPRTSVASSLPELAAATARYETFVARPAFSRGGAHVYTNVGPRAGERIECRPSAQLPWIVQEYVEGIDVCTFSIVRQGQVTAHAAYVHPRSIEHAGGIALESVDEPETLAITRAIVEATGYEGQLAFDLRKTARGLTLIECNPRPTVGVCFLGTAAFGDAVFGPLPRQTYVVPAGRRRKFTIALLRDMIVHPRDAAKDWPHLVSDAPDVFADPRDPLPAFYQFLTYPLITRYRRTKRTRAKSPVDLMAGYTFDVAYDG
jgi:glutathione synthase/RimK-type ligase-like ATP-grasp enzyme